MIDGSYQAWIDSFATDYMIRDGLSSHEAAGRYFTPFWYRMNLEHCTARLATARLIFGRHAALATEIHTAYARIAS